MDNDSRPGNALIGAAGEHYVAFQLCARGWAVGLAPRGARAADLLVANLDTGKSVTMQVKTMFDSFTQSRKWGAHWKWRVGVRRQDPSESFYYVFVDMGGDLSKAPKVFVVPSLELTPPLLEQFPENGPPFTDAWCTIYGGKEGAYLSQWDRIEAALT